MAEIVEQATNAAVSAEAPASACFSGLLGEFNHKMDAKGRVSLPASFRKTVPEGAALVIAPSYSQECLCVYEWNDYLKWIEAVLRDEAKLKDEDGHNYIDDDLGDLERELRTAAFPASIDDLGRISVIPDHRAGFLNGAKEVTICAGRDCVEIWDKQARDEKRAKAQAARQARRAARLAR